MHKLTVNGQVNSSTLLVGERLQNVRSYIDAKDVVVITDTLVDQLYHDQFPAG